MRQSKKKWLSHSHLLSNAGK